MQYHVENRKLDAKHHIVIDQLEFGAATESKQAVPLPIKLAVSLLKDRNGVIDLDLPVGGSLDDPTFRIGPIIWKVFVNLIDEDRHGAVCAARLAVRRWTRAVVRRFSRRRRDPDGRADSRSSRNWRMRWSSGRS